MTTSRQRLEWTPREVPLRARAVVASGAAAKRLGTRLAALDDNALHALAAVAGEDVIVALGDEAALPWVDGATYLGRDDAAPMLLLPTALAPSMSAALLEVAVRRRVPAALVAVVPEPARLVDCAAARAVDRERLRAWIEAR